MNDLIVIPTVEQINLEHRLANSKASEAVQHATNCGLMLLQVKASLNHGEWLPWLKQQQESGAVGFSHMTANRYMRLASNITRVLDLPEAPSLRAALELLSDKEPEAEAQGTLIDVEAERQAREAAEAKAEAERQARLVAEQRSEEWRQTTRFHKKQAEAFELELIQERKRSAEASERIIEKEVIPDDYDSLKAKSAQLDQVKAELDKIKKEQASLINEQVRAKLRGYQDEVNEMEKKKSSIEYIVARKQAYLDSLSSEVKRVETHREVINGGRLELIGLAAFLNDMEPMNDHDTVQRWLALADMHQTAAESIRMVFGPAHPKLTVIHGA